MAMDEYGPITQNLVARIYTDAADRNEQVKSGKLNPLQALNDQTMAIGDAVAHAIAALEAKIDALTKT